MLTIHTTRLTNAIPPSRMKRMRHYCLLLTLLPSLASFLYVFLTGVLHTQSKESGANIALQDKEESEIKEAIEGKLKMIQLDIEQVKKSHVFELDKVNSDMGEVMKRLGKMKGLINLEEDKRKVTLGRDKALEQIGDVNKVRFAMNKATYLAKTFT